MPGLLLSTTLLLCSFILLSSTNPEDYLERYGYLSVDPAAASDKTELLSASILKFQDYHGLAPTGELDEDTLEQMNSARCGLPDVEEEEGSSSGRLKRYALASRWRKRDLKYHISAYSKNKGLSTDSVDKVFERALRLWQEAADLRITKAKREKQADLIISFLEGAHETNRTSHKDKQLAFDGPGGVLAHASFPTVGEIHFDDGENWLLHGARKDGYNLMWGAVHEVGHALGLKHTRAKNSVMNPIYKRGVFNRLGEDDINGIVRLYGPAKPVTEAITTKEPASASTDFAFLSSTKASCVVPDRTDAVLTIGKAFFMFRSDMVWMFNIHTNRPHYPVKISSAFSGITGPITAAMAGINNKIYFFRGKMFWRWDWVKKAVDPGYPRHVRSEFGNIYTNVIAAFRWNHNKKGYVFGDNGQYWRYDFFSGSVDPGYPRNIRTWRGIPGNLDDITSGPDGKTYIFKDKSFWVYSDRMYRLQGRRYSIEDRWLSCGDLNANMMAGEESTEVANLMDDSSSSGSVAETPLLNSLLLFLLPLTVYL